jgi:hypothetical protein
MKRSSMLPALSVLFEILALGAAALLVMALVTAEARAGALPNDTQVRVVGSGIEPGWFEGKIFITGEGCTMVKLSRATKDRYTMLALVAVANIEKKNGAQWTALSLDELKAKEPKRCLAAGAD